MSWRKMVLSKEVRKKWWGLQPCVLLQQSLTQRNCKNDRMPIDIQLPFYWMVYTQNNFFLQITTGHLSCEKMARRFLGAVKAPQYFQLCNDPLARMLPHFLSVGFNCRSIEWVRSQLLSCPGVSQNDLIGLVDFCMPTGMIGVSMKPHAATFSSPHI